MYKLLGILTLITFSCYQKSDQLNKTIDKVFDLQNDKQIHISYRNIKDGDASFSYFDNYDEQYKLIGKLGNIQNIDWDDSFTLSLLTTAFNATYPIKCADSIIINSLGNKGFKLEIPNSKYNNFEINFFNYLSNSNQNILDFYYRKLMQISSYPLKGSILETYNKSLFILDSCLNVGLIRKEYYNWAFPILKFEFEKCKLNLASALNIKEVESNLNLADKLKSYYGRNFMQNNLVLNDLHSSFTKVDFTKAYKYVKSKYSNEEKNYLLFFTTKQLLEKNSNKKELYISTFRKDVTDRFYTNYFDINYPNHKIKTSSIILIDKNNKEIYYDSVVALNKGNVLYLDNWASWCVPCRVEMQSTKDLLEYYKGKKIKIIYISIDEKIQDWLKAIKEMNIAESDNCYLLKDPKSSQYTKEFKITEIPRYILIDKNGKVINDKAPSASDNELKKIISNVASKK